MSGAKKQKLRETNVLPAEIWRQYPGKWIIYSDDERRVIGAADTLEEASAQANASGVKGSGTTTMPFRRRKNSLGHCDANPVR